MEPTSDTITWLLEGSPYVEYWTRCDLLDQPEDDPRVAAARRAMLADPQVQSLIAELADWPRTVISSYKSAGQPFHKLTFLADLGLRADDPGVDAIMERVGIRPEEGPFALADPAGAADPSANGELKRLVIESRRLATLKEDR